MILCRLQQLAALLAVGLSLSMQLGCFNAEALIESRRLVAIKARLEEIDLGKYRISLPQTESVTETIEVNFHVFGQVANRDMETVSQLLESSRPEIRDQLLVVTRNLSEAELEDPELSSLREHIAKVVNNTLEGDPVQSVGFYNFRYAIF